MKRHAFDCSFFLRIGWLIYDRPSIVDALIDHLGPCFPPGRWRCLAWKIAWKQEGEIPYVDTTWLHHLTSNQKVMHDYDPGIVLLDDWSIQQNTKPFKPPSNQPTNQPWTPKPSPQNPSNQPQPKIQPYPLNKTHSIQADCTFPSHAGRSWRTMLGWSPRRMTAHCEPLGEGWRSDQGKIIGFTTRTWWFLPFFKTSTDIWFGAVYTWEKLQKAENGFFPRDL